MDRRHWRYLIALADTLSFTRAAERVGIAQPPFSKQIKDLELEIGTPLVRRLPRRVELTAAGAAFVARARAIERSVEQAVATARRVGEGLEGRLRVGFTESGIFHPAISTIFLEFRRLNPQIELELEERSSTTLVEMLRAEAVDAIFLRPPFPEFRDVACLPMLRETMMVAVPRGHRLGTRPRLRLRDLAGETFVFYHRRVRPGLTDVVIDACRRDGFEPREGQVAPQLTSTLRLVAAGAGISVVPASLSALRFDGVVLIPLDHPTLHAGIGLASRADAHLAALDRFAALARDICAAWKDA